MLLWVQLAIGTGQGRELGCRRRGVPRRESLIPVWGRKKRKIASQRQAERSGVLGCRGLASGPRGSEALAAPEEVKGLPLRIASHCCTRAPGRVSRAGGVGQDAK